MMGQCSFLFVHDDLDESDWLAVSIPTAGTQIMTLVMNGDLTPIDNTQERLPLPIPDCLYSS